MTEVHFQREGGADCPGYIHVPAKETGERIGVVVVQEWWGVNSQILAWAKDLTTRTGFRSLVPDLYRGKVATDREEAGHLFEGLDWPGAIADITSAARFLRLTGSRKVAVVGFCMGGALSLATAALQKESELDAAISFYGIPDASLCNVSGIKIPIQAHFGNDDPIKGFSDPDAAKKLESDLQSGNVSFEIHRYPSVAHAFMNLELHSDTPPKVYSDAYSSLISFVQTHLGVAKVGNPAPNFSEEALVGKEFKTLTLSEFSGKYLILFFYPLDFTFVCPTEILAFSDRIAEFEKLEAKVVGVSIDSVYTHLAWTNSPREDGGLGGPLKYPLIADLRKKLAEDYDVLLGNSGHTLRGTFIIDPKGKIVHISKNDAPVGRNVDEILRLIQAFQFVAEHGEVCPADWQPGKSTMEADPVKSKKYFKSAGKK